MSTLHDLLASRYPAPSWCLLFEVRDKAGFNATRSADAVALPLWPSQGDKVHGFEFKTSRSDLMRELTDPAKSDAVGQYCHHWWLVVDDAKLVDGVEVPERWGVLARKARSLHVIKKAPLRDAMPLSVTFVASMMVRATKDLITRARHDEVCNSIRQKATAATTSSDAFAKLSAQLVDAHEQIDALKKEREAFGMRTWDAPSQQRVKRALEIASRFDSVKERIEAISAMLSETKRLAGDV